MQQENKTGFLLYANYFDILQDLSNEDAGVLFKAILNYQANNIIPELPSHLNMAFKFIKNQFDVDEEKYNKKLEKARENGLKGGRPKKEETEKNQKNQTVFKKTNGLKKSYKDNVNVNVNVNDNVNDNVNVITPYSPPKENLCGEEKIKEIFSSELNQQETPIKQVDPFADSLIDKCFTIYQENCPDLCKLRFERRSKDVRELTAKVLTEIDRDIGVFTEICKKANDLKIIVDKQIDFKKMLNCYQGILNGKYNVVSSPLEESRDELIKRINARLDRTERG